jgi:nucleoside-diphosphate kinase
MQHTKEKSLVIIKPDGIQRTLIGEIIKRIERVGFKLVALKFQIPTSDIVKAHYTIDPEWIEKTGAKALRAKKENGDDVSNIEPLQFGETILTSLQKYMTSGPVVVMVWEGAHVVDVVRKLVGGTEPKTSDVGTIRGDFVHDSYEISNIENRSVRNVLHASSSVEDAEKEIQVWFKSEEIMSYRLIAEEILYDVNLDGKKE